MANFPRYSSSTLVGVKCIAIRDKYYQFITYSIYKYILKDRNENETRCDIDTIDKD